MKATLKRINSLWVLYLLFASLVIGCSGAQAAEVVIPEGYKLVSINSLEKLKSNNSRLIMKLEELEMQISLLKSPSSELSRQLAEVEKQLGESQKDLTSSRERLQSVELLQKQTQSSLSLLEQQIATERKQEERTQKRLLRQRNTAYAFLGIALLGYIKKL